MVSKLLADVEATALAVDDDHPLARPVAGWLGKARWARDRAVLFVEPRQGWFLPDHGMELRSAMAVKLGMHAIKQRANPPGINNWILKFDDLVPVLNDPTGACFARFELRASLQWHAHRARNGTVLVLYGASIGVRCPPGVPASSYNDEARQQELLNSLLAHTVAWGVVAAP